MEGPIALRRRVACPPGHCGEVGRRHEISLGISDADVEEVLRSAGLDHLSAARGLVLEPSGKSSVLKSARPPEATQNSGGSGGS
jgi:hypothetical protein